MPPFPNQQTRRGRGINKGRMCSRKVRLLLPKSLNLKKGQKSPKGHKRKTSTKGTGMERMPERRPRVPTWNPPLVLNGAPLPLDSSIRDFQKGKAGYVANVLEQPLLLPQDMVDLRTLKKHEVFLTLKRDLAINALHFTFYIKYIRTFLSLSSLHK